MISSRTFTAIVATLLAAACSRRPEGDKAHSHAEATPVAARPAKPSPKQGADSMDACCCVSKDSAEGDVFAVDCAKHGGRCVTPWTEQCTRDWQDQQAADERNSADTACASGDRHDCDGDGVRAADDKNDLDPKVH